MIFCTFLVMLPIPSLDIGQVMSVPKEVICCHCKLHGTTIGQHLIEAALDATYNTAHLLLIWSQALGAGHNIATGNMLEI